MHPEVNQPPPPYQPCGCVARLRPGVTLAPWRQKLWDVVGGVMPLQHPFASDAVMGTGTVEPLSAEAVPADLLALTPEQRGAIARVLADVAVDGTTVLSIERELAAGQTLAVDCEHVEVAPCVKHRRGPQDAVNPNDRMLASAAVTAAPGLAIVVRCPVEGDPRVPIAMSTSWVGLTHEQAMNIVVGCALAARQAAAQLGPSPTEGLAVFDQLFNCNAPMGAAHVVTIQRRAQ